MKKNILIICFIITLVMIVQPLASEAGTFFLGVKGYYTIWDSGILDWLEKDIAISFKQNRLEFDATRDEGDGYMAGPLFGYQTDDGKWSFSFAPMIISSFSQDWDGSAGAMNLSGDAELKRRDYDLAVNYTLSEYFKIFAGYKFQDMDLDFNLTYSTTMGTQTDTFDVEAQAHIPSFGVGAVYPIHEKVVMSGQAGLLYPMMELKMTNEAGQTDDILPHSGLGFNSEVSLTYQPWESVIIQLGYRYQVFEFEARGPGRTQINKSRDITHGPTLSAVYVF